MRNITLNKSGLNSDSVSCRDSLKCICIGATNIKRHRIHSEEFRKSFFVSQTSR